MKTLVLCILLIAVTVTAASRPRSPGGRRNRPPARGPPTRYGCPPASCPLEDQYQCYVRPCQFARCRNFPGARCCDDYCGGCRAVFYYNGKEVDCGARERPSKRQ